jgi:hypothetical protein
MKVFVSHQQADSAIASSVALRLRQNNVECYVDIIDRNIAQSGEVLGNYLRNEMGKCTQLLAVVSANTKQSSWVPWEIGVATEKNFPLATFFGDNTPAPEFLRQWPYLRSLSDVDHYVAASRLADRTFISKKVFVAEDSARRESTAEFFRSLRNSLRQ